MDGRVFQGNTRIKVLEERGYPVDDFATGRDPMKTRERTPASKPIRRLYGPTVRQTDGTVVTGSPLHTEEILAAFERLDVDARRAFLCVFAHDLTVAIRALLLDRPVAEADLDRVWKINEFMHQLTSCANPQGRWSAHDTAVLVGDTIETSFSYDLDRWVGHALATAAGNTIGKKEPVAAK